MRAWFVCKVKEHAPCSYSGNSHREATGIRLLEGHVWCANSCGAFGLMNALALMRGINPSQLTQRHAVEMRKFVYHNSNKMHYVKGLVHRKMKIV